MSDAERIYAAPADEGPTGGATPVGSASRPTVSRSSVTSSAQVSHSRRCRRNAAHSCCKSGSFHTRDGPRSSQSFRFTKAMPAFCPWPPKLKPCTVKKDFIASFSLSMKRRSICSRRRAASEATRRPIIAGGSINQVYTYGHEPGTHEEREVVPAGERDETQIAFEHDGLGLAGDAGEAEAGGGLHLLDVHHEAAVAADRDDADVRPGEAGGDRAGDGLGVRRVQLHEALVRRAEETGVELLSYAFDDAVKTLVLSHLVPGDNPSITDDQWTEGARKHFKGRIIVGKDLMEIPR